MTTDIDERTRIASDLLQCKATEVQALVRAMPRTERFALTERIDGVLDWLADYEAEETWQQANRSTR